MKYAARLTKIMLFVTNDDDNDLDIRIFFNVWLFKD